MNDALAPVQQWFTQLAPRERIMVSVCGVFIVLAAIWSLGLKPLFVNGAELAERVADKQARLATMQELASQIRPAGDASSGASARPGSGASNDSIVVVIDRTTRSRQLAQYLKRNQPDGNTGVRLRFEGALFDDLVAWLGELKQNYGMTMVTANFDESASGRVNCSIVMSRAGN